jgi:hypothetical protein
MIDFRINRDQDDILDTSGQKGRAKVDMNSAVFEALAFAKRYRRCEHVIEWNGKSAKSVKTAFKGALRRAGVTEKVFRGSRLPAHHRHYFVRCRRRTARHPASSWT